MEYLAAGCRQAHGIAGERMVEKKRGQRRHSLGREAGNVPTESIDEEQRAVLRKPLYEAPGSTEHRGRASRSKASDGNAVGRQRGPRGTNASNQSMRQERRAEEQAAAEREPTLDEIFAAVEREAEGIRRAKQERQQRLVDERAKVWQLGSWMNGDKPCPEEVLRWEA